MADGWVVLIVERVVGAADGLAQAFEAAGGSPLRAATAGEAIQAMVDHPVDVVVAAVDLPGESGLAVLQHVQELDSERHLPVVMLCPDEDAAGRLRALSVGADDCVPRSTPADEVVARAQRCLKLRRRIDALVTEQARLRELSITDGLTNLANHRYFQERLSDEFRRAQRYDDPLSLIILDIDHFKLVNDHYGHTTGDEVLAAVADLLRLNVRPVDSVCRYGGEELAVILPETGEDGAAMVAERIRRTVAGAAIATPAGQTVRITVSIGVADSTQAGDSTDVVRVADMALYAAKREGRNRVRRH